MATSGQIMAMFLFFGAIITAVGAGAVLYFEFQSEALTQELQAQRVKQCR